MPRNGHFSLWLVDTLARLCDGWLKPGSDAYPPALLGWRRTRLDVAPLTTRGIDWPSLKALTGAGAQAIGLSTLERPEEVQAVLQHGALAAAGDAAGIERATGLRTSGARLQRVVACVCAQAASDAMLNAAGVMELQARLHGTAGDGPPRELAVSALPRPATRPNAPGPLPFDGGQAGGARSAAAVVEPAPPVPPPQEDEGGEGGEDEGGEDEGGEAVPECTCKAKRFCKCPWYLAMSKPEQRRLKARERDRKRNARQVCTDNPSNLQSLDVFSSYLTSLGCRMTPMETTATHARRKSAKPWSKCEKQRGGAGRRKRRRRRRRQRRRRRKRKRRRRRRRRKRRCAMHGAYYAMHYV
jgi:hypothetical protein